MAFPAEEVQPFLADLQAEAEDDLSDASDEEFDELLSDSGSEADEMEAADSDVDDDLEEEDGGSRGGGRRRGALVAMGRDNVTAWRAQPAADAVRPPILGRQNRAAGPTVGVTNPVHLISAFLDDILQVICTHTNEKVAGARGSQAGLQDYQTQILSMNELRAFIGLLFMNAVLKNSYLRLDALRSSQLGPAIFGCTMSLNRMKFLLKTLQFDEAVTREHRRQQDKFALFRDVWTLFMDRCQRNFQPSGYMIIDETLLSIRSWCGFKVYMPSKPDRYGLKLFSLCDAGTSYLYNSLPYVGKGTLSAGPLKITTQQAQLVHRQHPGLEILQPSLTAVGTSNLLVRVGANDLQDVVEKGAN